MKHDRYSHPHKNPLDHPWRDRGRAIRASREHAQWLQNTYVPLEGVSRRELESIALSLPAFRSDRTKSGKNGYALGWDEV